MVMLVFYNNDIIIKIKTPITPPIAIINRFIKFKCICVTPRKFKIPTKIKPTIVFIAKYLNILKVNLKNKTPTKIINISKIRCSKLINNHLINNSLRSSSDIIT